MTDWVHCNACFHQPGQLPKREFQLTSCGHIFCLCCERSGSIEQCKLCQVKCTTVHLSAQMAPEVMTYFEEPADALEQILTVLRFQKSHCKRLNEFYRSVLEKYLRAKVYIQRIEEENRRLKKEIEIIKNCQNSNIMTPPSTIPQKPLFSKNSQASKVIRKGLSQIQPKPLNKPLNKSSFFATPARSQSYGSQQYRSQNMTPVTPESDVSYSPDSQSSGGSQGVKGAGLLNSSQTSYKSPVTPPTNNLRMMYVHSLQPRAILKRSG